MATAAVLRAIVTTEGTERAAAKLKAFGGTVDTTAKTGSARLTALKTIGNAAFLALGAAAVVGLGKAVSAAEDLGLETLKLSRQLGVSAQDASRLISVGHDLGVSFDQLSVGFGIFEKHLVDGGKQFEKYGIQIKNADGTQKTFNEVLGEAADKYKALGPGVQGTAFAMDVFGRSGKLLLPILAQGSAGVADLMKKSDELGTTLSGKDVRASLALARSQRELQQEFLGIEVSIGKAVMPALTGLAHGISGILNWFQKLPGPVHAFVGGLLAVAIATKAITAGVSLAKGALGTLGGGFAKASVAKDEFATNVTGTLVPALGAAETGIGTLGSAAVGVLGPLGAAAAVTVVAAHGAHQLANGVQADIATVTKWGTTTAQGRAAMVRLNATLDTTRRTFHGVSIDSGHAGSSVAAAMAKAASYTDGFGAAAGHATGEVARLNAVINAIPRKVQTDYYFVVHGNPYGNVVRKAEGGMVGYAGGGSPPSVLELTRPTYIGGNAIAGEGGREFVLPANARGANWIKDAVRQGVVESGISGGGGPVHVTINLDGRDITGYQHRMEVLRGVKS